VNEQQVPEKPEWDELDEHCLRVLAREQLAACRTPDRSAAWRPFQAA